MFAKPLQSLFDYYEVINNIFSSSRIEISFGLERLDHVVDTVGTPPFQTPEIE